MSKMAWFCVWHEMLPDPKWRTIARKSGQPVHAVIAVWMAVLTTASANTDARGHIVGLDVEDVGSALDMDADDVSAILAAMQGRVLDGDAVTGWDERQNNPSRDPGARDRKRAQREREDAARLAGQSQTPSDASEKSQPVPDEGVTERDCHTHYTTLQNNTEVSKESANALSARAPAPADAPHSKAITLKAVPPITQAVAAWNALRSEQWPAQREPDIHDTRRKKITARLREHGLDGWTSAITNIRGSPFLLGHSGKFKATLDWLIEPTNFAKVIEGNYADTHRNGTSQISKSGRGGGGGFARLLERTSDELRWAE